MIDADGVNPMPGDNGPGDDSDHGPRIWDAVDLKPSEQPRWLANGRLPRAAVSLLLGDEGIGTLFCQCQTGIQICPVSDREHSSTRNC